MIYRRDNNQMSYYDIVWDSAANTPIQNVYATEKNVGYGSIPHHYLLKVNLWQYLDLITITCESKRKFGVRLIPYYLVKSWHLI